jgi:uncharacterized protein YegL
LTKQGYTALVFVVDNSGSMYGIHEDMEGAIKTLLEEQQKLPGTLTVDFVNFSSTVRRVYEAADPALVKVSIIPSGGTALHDAVGQTIAKVGARLAKTPEDERPEKVVFAIVTDGHENSSREYNAAGVKKAVEHQTTKYDWDFVYLGANQDAVFVAQTLGVRGSSALTWNSKNVAVAAASLGNYTTSTRSGVAYAFTEADREANK